MLYYSTNKQVSGVNLKDVVIKGLADDRGLFMPNNIPVLKEEFYQQIEDMNLQEIAYEVAFAFLGRYSCR